MSTTLTHPRCILFDRRGRRCRRRAALRRMGNLYTCTRHGCITLLILDDRLSAPSRRRLACTRWRTYNEAQQHVDQWRRAA